MADGTPERLSALILAGGRSRRMGRDKAWLPLEGTPLIERIVGRILPLVDEVIFSGNSPESFEQLQRSLPLPAQLVKDERPGLGPLAGIAAGLSASAHELVLVLAVDMPFVQVGLLSYMVGLAGDYQAVVPLIPDPLSGRLRPEPLHALYRRSCLVPITIRLEAGSRRVSSFLPDVRTRWVLPDEIARHDPSFISFRNLNTPADLDSAVNQSKHS